MAMTFAVWLDFNSRVDERPNNAPSAWYWRLLFLIAAFGISIFLGYTRIVTANHTFDQVLVGLMLGVWFTLSAHFIIRD